ncbi:MAG: DNA polymerase sliding clamp [Halobacteria archaeon]
MPSAAGSAVTVFRASIGAGVLRDSLEAASILVDEGRFKVSRGELTLRAVDAANVAMVAISLAAKGFEKFEGREAEFGVDLKKFLEFLGMAEGADRVEIEVDDEARKLHLVLGNLKASLGLLDLAHIRKDPTIPPLDLPARVRLAGADFRTGIRAAEKVSDYLALAVEEDAFAMEAKGDTDRVRLEIPKASLIELKWASKPSKIRSLYSLDYLSDMTKAIGKAPEVSLELGSDYPVKMKFEVAGGKGSVEYLLAPRIENE